MALFRSNKPNERLVLTADQAVLIAAPTVVWSSSSSSEDPGWDGVSTYVVQRDGWYVVHSFLTRKAQASNQRFANQIRINGVRQAHQEAIAGTVEIYSESTFFGPLVAGDAITVAALAVSGTLTLKANECFATFGRLGPKRWT